MSSETHLIRLQKVVKDYGRQRVLVVDDLTLHPRRSILLHGGNASGKSTLLRILGGISTIDKGTISYHPILKRRRLGFLPQLGGLYADLTLEDNLGLRRRLFGLPEVPLEGLWYIEELGLIPFLRRQVSELSGGFARLGAMAATLHCEPSWLLLDEPLSGVDARARGVLREHFAQVMKRADLCVVAAPSADGDLGADTRIEVRDGRIE